MFVLLFFSIILLFYFFSFIEAIVSNSDILISYFDLFKKHKQTSVRSRKSTYLNKTNHSLQEKLAQLSGLMDKASKINIKLQQGLPNMIVLLKSKQALLTGIIASYQAIINETVVSGVIAMLKKRCHLAASKSENKKSWKRQWQHPMLRSNAWKFSWRYDNSEVKNIKNFNSWRVCSLAAETESNFCVHISSTETNDDIDAVLENFPVIYFCNKK